MKCFVVPLVVISHKSSGLLHALAFIKMCILDMMVLLEGRSLEESPDTIQLISQSPSSFTILTGWRFFAILLAIMLSWLYHIIVISSRLAKPHSCVDYFCFLQRSVGQLLLSIPLLLLPVFRQDGSVGDADIVPMLMLLHALLSNIIATNVTALILIWIPNSAIGQSPQEVNKQNYVNCVNFV